METIYQLLSLISSNQFLRKWHTQKKNVIYIDEQLVPERIMNDGLTFCQRKHIAKTPKGNSTFSISQQTLPPQAIRILKRARNLTLDVE